MHSFRSLSPLPVTTLYTLAATLWILSSDQILQQLTTSEANLAILQTYKGMVFVVVTSLVLYLLLSTVERRHERRIEHIEQTKIQLEQRLQDRTQELDHLHSRMLEQEQTNMRFMGELAHTLRTPLASLNIRLDMLRRVPTEQRENYMEKTMQQIDYMNHLLNDMLEISLLNDSDSQPVVLKPVDLNGQIVQALAMHKPQAERAGLQVTYMPDTNLPPVLAEDGCVARIVDNLIANSVKYTLQGEIRITTSYDTQRNMVRLAVSDTGIGITPEDMTHVFERFYRGRRARQSGIQGSGLGLDIVRQSLEIVEGSIDVQSKPGSGSTFIVWLNRAAQGA